MHGFHTAPLGRESLSRTFTQDFILGYFRPLPTGVAYNGQKAEELRNPRAQKRDWGTQYPASGFERKVKYGPLASYPGPSYKSVTAL